MKPILTCIVLLGLLGMPTMSFAGQDSVSTEKAQLFFSTYLQGQIQEWPKYLPKESDIQKGEKGHQIRKGIALLRTTSQLAGPLAKNPDNRRSQNNLNCIQCHAAGPSGLPGTMPGQLPYVNVVHEYPKLDSKSMKIITLQDRIRGMFGGGNGKLTDDSSEMKAILAYFEWLGMSTKPNAKVKGGFLKEIPSPKRAADPKQGKVLYRRHCMSCHGEKGLGVKNPDFNFGGGYTFPPVAGDDTYTDGGHMYSVPILARFIYGYMPLGATIKKPQITPQEAYDIAAYINADLPRKHDPKRAGHYPNPAFRPAYIAYPEFFPNNPKALKHAKFGPFSKQELKDFR